MNISYEKRILLRRVGGLIALSAALCVIIIYQFTLRTTAQSERERAQIMLQRIYDLQMAYRAENGTYLPIDRERNGDILRLNDGVGLFAYRVIVNGDQFVARAEADLNGDGQMEVWQMTPHSDEPVQTQAD